MSTTESMLQEGIAAARAGDREAARALLMQVVEADERNEQGWLWLAGVIDDPDEMRTCLENVLDLNPGNVKAQQGLVWIDSRYGPRVEHSAAPAPESAADPEPTADRRGGTAYTGPTDRLVSPTEVDVPIPVPGRPQPTPPIQPAPIEPSALPDNPCPYCGAPTTLSQKHCTQCHKDLMIRDAPRDKRSVPLTILGWLWCIGGALSLLGGVLLLIGLFLPQANGGGAAISRERMVGNVFGTVLGGLIYFAIGRGLLRRARWAYIVHCILTALGLIAVLLQIAIGGGVLALLTGVSSRQISAPEARTAGILGTVIGVALFCLVIWELLYILLTVLSYRDFYGPMARFLPTVAAGSHKEHYNSGVAYKDRGMWYMATKEWEVAVSKAPRDLNYLHALGLAYTQIKKLYPHSTPHLVGVKHLLLSRKAELYSVAPELEHLDLL